jgi:tetratricopeptide (TPR) repeat protein
MGGAFFTIILLSLVIRWMWSVTRPPAAPVWTVPALTSELDRLETLLLGGRPAFAAESLRQIEPPILEIQGQDGEVLRARLRLVAGDLFAWTQQPDAAKSQLREALTLVDGIDDPVLAFELRTRAEASLGRLSADSTTEPELVASGRAAVERESRIRRPEVILRLVWAAHHLALIEHREGRWDTARSLLERAAAIGLRLERPARTAPDSAWDAGARELLWSHGRKAASEAARDLGHVLGSLGDRERALAWLDQAIALVEGADLPIARLRLSHALIDRAGNEPVDAFTGLGGHEALYERAVEVALSCENADGKTTACMAEAAWASLYLPLGLPEKNQEHLRRALALTDEMVEPAAGHNLTYLYAELGFGQDSSGDHDGALVTLQQAVDRGRAHPDPEARKLAVQSAYRRHMRLIEAERLEEARGCVEVIEQLVPTLDPQARPTFAGIAAHSRGIQYLFEERYYDARHALEQAESLAHQAGAAALERSAAADLGRVSMRIGQPAEAEPHLRRALETPVPQDNPIESQSRRAEILMLLAQALLGLERPEEALRECRRAYDLGRNAGDARGREVAAIAAMHLGEAADEQSDERRTYYETASRFGRLCGRARGRQVAETVDARLREATG